MPNRLNNQPPITAPTIPKPMSRKNPSPVLLTSLLPMKPAISPSTIHAMIDMVYPPGFGTTGVATRSPGPRAAVASADDQNSTVGVKIRIQRGSCPPRQFHPFGSLD